MHPERARRYVDVIARFRDDGTLVPLSVLWPDGRTFQIEEVVGGPAADSMPGSPERTFRYEVRVAGRVTRLYLERSIPGKEPVTRWYVEAIRTPSPWRLPE